MAELLTIITKALLQLLARLDKEKHKKLVGDFYHRLNADPCGLLVEQLHSGTCGADTALPTAEKCKGGER